MINQGFCISVRSWENDGDFYRTVLVDGLSEYQVKWYLCFLTHLGSCVSNDFIPEKEKVLIYREVCEEFQNRNELNEDIPAAPEDIEDAFSNILYTFGLWSMEQDGEYLVRVIDKIEVYYFSYLVEDIKYKF